MEKIVKEANLKLLLPERSLEKIASGVACQLMRAEGCHHHSVQIIIAQEVPKEPGVMWEALEEMRGLPNTKTLGLLRDPLWRRKCPALSWRLAVSHARL